MLFAMFQEVVQQGSAFAVSSDAVIFILMTCCIGLAVLSLVVILKLRAFHAKEKKELLKKQGDFHRVVRIVTDLYDQSGFTEGIEGSEKLGIWDMLVPIIYYLGRGEVGPSEPQLLCVIEECNNEVGKIFSTSVVTKNMPVWSKRRGTSLELFEGFMITVYKQWHERLTNRRQEYINKTFKDFEDANTFESLQGYEEKLSLIETWLVEPAFDASSLTVGRDPLTKESLLLEGKDIRRRIAQYYFESLFAQSLLHPEHVDGDPLSMQSWNTLVEYIEAAGGFKESGINENDYASLLSQLTETLDVRKSR